MISINGGHSKDFQVEHNENLNTPEELRTTNSSSVLCESEIDSQNSAEGETSKMAWIGAFVSFLINGCCSMMWMTAPSTPSVMYKWMDVSLTQLNWLSNGSAILNSIFSLLTAWIYDKFGLKFSLICCGFINAAGCWIRCIAIIAPTDKRYLLVMLGQLFASIGGPLVYSIGAKFVSVWFAPRHRGIANNILSIQIGIAIAPLVLPIIAPTPEDVPRMLIIVAIVSSVCTIPAFLIRKAPKVPPSITSTVERTPFFEGVKAISKNFQLWTVIFLASVTIGMVFSIATLVIEAISPYGYTEQESGVCASVIVFSGFLGGAMSGYWVGETAQHIMLIKIFTPITIFTYVIFIFNLIPNAFATVLIACIINGFFSYSLFPLYLELASEISYPVSESICSSIIWCLCTVTMLIFSVIIDALRAGPDANPPNNMNASLIAAAIIMTVGSIPCLWLKADLKRLQVDNEKKNNSATKNV